MVIPIKTYNAYHLGDNLIHLNWLRKVVQWSGRPAIHYCLPDYIEALRPFVAGDAIEILPLAKPGSDAVDSWINANGEYENVAFRRNWLVSPGAFRRLARRWGFRTDGEAPATCGFSR